MQPHITMLIRLFHMETIIKNMSTCTEKYTYIIIFFFNESKKKKTET